MTKIELELIKKIIETFKQIPDHSKEMLIPYIRENHPEVSHIANDSLIFFLKAGLYGDVIESKIAGALGK